ncbi:MAG TPA: Xaa-Pro peptidase family protein [bacterium]|nr:Xaa-Pro peptidase family protein [bacterium]
MDSQHRLDRVRDAMVQQAIDLLAVPPGDDLQYLLDFSPHADERPCYLFLTTEALVFLVPEVNAKQSASYVSDPLLTYSDADGPGRAVIEARKRFGSRRRVGVGDTMRADAVLLLQQQWREAEFVPASSALAPLRMRKTRSEIEALRRAAATADAAVQAAWRVCRPGVTEAELASAAEAGFRAAGAAQVTFAIVGSGPNSAFPHHHTSARQAKSGEPVLFDLGSRVDYYCSDITRMAYLGKPPAHYQEIHAIVDEAVAEALATIRPGIPSKAVDLAARGVIERAGYGPNFVHRIGHGIGLSEHEPPSITNTNDLVLEEGMTFSVEPGIYLPGEFGVRLEEIAVVTARGVEILSRLARTVHIV